MITKTLNAPILNVLFVANNFFVRLLNPTLKLSKEDDLALLSLQARGDVLDKYITINAVNTNRPLHEVTAKVKQDIFEIILGHVWKPLQ